MFIDDEADVSNCGDTTAATAINNSSSEDDDDNDVDFDSSFIDDEKSIPSTSMTIQYLQSVKYATFLYLSVLIKINIVRTNLIIPNSHNKSTQFCMKFQLIFLIKIVFSQFKIIN